MKMIINHLIKLWGLNFPFASYKEMSSDTNANSETT